MQITVGADPEVFVKERRSWRSAHGLIPGTKEDPFKVPYGAVQVDGMALEFNIDPAKTEEEFTYNINTVLNHLKGMIPDNYKIAISPVAPFNPRYFDEQPEEAKRLGCDPDYNAYTLSQNPSPNAKVKYRTAAGHVHIGFTENADVNSIDHIMDCAGLAKELDITLGIPSVILDEDERRRKLYGRAGCFRPKPYGMEYRVLSNFWLQSDDLVRWVYRQVNRTVERLSSPVVRNYQSFQHYLIPIEDIINDSKKEDARALVKDFGIEMP